MSNTQLLTTREVAQILGVSTQTVYRLKEKPGALISYKIGGCVRFKAEEVQEYIDRKKEVPMEKNDPLGGIRRFKYVPGMKVV